MSGTGATSDVCVVGGCGRAGLPLAIAFANAGLRVVAHDVDRERAGAVAGGRMPFREETAESALARALGSGCLSVSTDPSSIGGAQHVVIVIGTPVDEFLSPSLGAFYRAVDEIGAHLTPGALLVLRSTVYPGTTENVAKRFGSRGIRVSVAFCPERIAEGHALEELATLPQIVGADDDEARARARTLFSHIVSELIDTTTREAEVAKLLNNAWRYMKFAIANHFFMVAQGAGLDYGRILEAVRRGYPRGADLPGPGFAAGPCLLKDTMQLAAFSQNTYMLGQMAMAVNEGLPAYVVDQIARRTDLAGRTVGLLGLAFKAESDDGRASLSYKLKKLLEQAGARVLSTDPYVSDASAVPLERVLAEADLFVIATPHRVYRDLDLSGRDVVDVWGVVRRAGDLLSPR